jgi:Ca2+-binding EF-hand superfamily protein
VTAAEATAAREALFNQRPLFRFIFQRTKEETARQGNQSAVAQGKPSLKDYLDSNHDGNITAPELRQAVQTSVQSLFLMADRNGDGHIDNNEINAAVADAGRAAIQTAFNAADTDKNGAVSQAEFDQALVKPGHILFAIFDANRDNQISHDELRSGMQIIQGELRAMRVPEPTITLGSQLRQPVAVPAPTAAPVAVPVQTVPAPATIPPPR